jgi:hypothetical protein
MARKNPLHVKHARNIPETLLPVELFNGLYTQVPLTRVLKDTIVATKQAVKRDETKIIKL